MELIRKVFEATCLLFVLSLFLSACGGPSEASEDEILSDIQENDEYFSTYGLIMDSFEITKRQTNEADKTDYVWANIEASNDDFTYTAEYTLTYVLYNDGWVLENCSTDTYDYMGLHPETISQEDAEQIVKGCGYSDVQYVGRDQDNNYVSFEFTGSKEEYYLKTVYDITVDYIFSPEWLWSDYNINYYETDNIPDIIGEWKCTVHDKNGKVIRDIYVNIIAFDASDPENGTITLEYDLNGVIAHWNGDQFKADCKSNGPVTIDMKFEEDRSYAKGELPNDNGWDPEITLILQKSTSPFRTVDSYTGEVLPDYGIFIEGDFLIKQ